MQMPIICLMFSLLANYKKLIEIVKIACPKMPRTEKTKESKLAKINESVNKKQYIDVLINNSNFQNVELLPPHSKSKVSDDQIFAYAVLPHIFTFHSSIVHISTSVDGHAHDKELYKLLLLLGKLRKYNFSITIICADGETGLNIFLHYYLFVKFL